MEEEKLEQSESEGDSTFQESEPEGISPEVMATGEEQEPNEAFTELQRSHDDLNDRYLRLAADFDNYKKRAARDNASQITYAIEQFVVEMLDVVDNLERAVSSDEINLREGLEQIQKLIGVVFERHGITPIETLNLPFNPETQEAIAYVPSDAGEGIVIDEIIRGYRMNDRIIRCAKVAVSKGKEVKEE